MKHLNLSTKGTVPLFRSYKPGFVPWFVDLEEAEMLRTAMEQLLEVAPRFRLDSSLLWPEAESDVCLIRVPQHNGPNATWIDDFREVAPSQHSSVYIELDNGLITKYRRLPLMKAPMEIDFFLVPEGIVDDGGRPKMPYALLMVDSEIGVVLACDVVIIETSMSAIWAGLCNRLLEKFINIGARPVSLTVRPGPLAVIAAALSKVLGFQLRTDRKLLSLNRAKAGLLRHMTENSDR
jgi:hypothetical protein